MCIARMARTLRSSATHSKSLLVFQMPTPQLRQFAKDLLQLVSPSEMLLHALRGCQVDDLKEAVRSEAVCFGSLSVPSLSWTLQDGRWVKEEKMSASLRETDEQSTWF